MAGTTLATPFTMFKVSMATFNEERAFCIISTFRPQSVGVHGFEAHVTVGLERDGNKS